MNQPLASTHRSAATPARWWRHRLLAPFNDIAAWDRLLTRVHPLWSLTDVRARVVRVVDEAPGVRSLWLQPSRRFRGFAPGQHVMLELEVAGVRQRRSFSLSHAPRADGLLRLTIKRKQAGPVSGGAHALQVGQVVSLSQAQGNFAPHQTDTPLLLISAGSGITPMLAWLHALADAGGTRDVVLVHSSAAQVIGETELRDLAARWPRLQLHLHLSATQGRLDAAQIAHYVPDWREREALLCGPDGFMHSVEAMYAAAGLAAQLQSESFGRRAARVDPAASAHTVHLSETKQVFTALAGQTLLDAAEGAGLTPRYGCRRGICHTCQCRKLSGSVLNVLTGLPSGAGEEWIQLCISTPQSAVDLAL